MKNIVLGANAVWQKVVDLDHFTKGKVLRANSVIAMASGKGANVAIAMERLRGKEQLGIENHLLLQTLGGLTGSAIETDLERFRFEHDFLTISETTRCCTTLREHGGSITELIEPSPSLCSSEWLSFGALCQKHMTKDHSRVKRQSRVLVCGSLPDGDASSFFDTWPQNQELWLDTVDLRWFACQPTVLKINRSELQTLSQLLSTKSFGSKDLNNPFSTDLNSKDSSPEAQCSALASEFGFEVIIVTDEQRSVSLWEGQSWTNFKPPHVKGLKNSIGAGDTFFAACAVARDHGRSWAEACTFACHVASQRCRFDLIEQLPNFRP